MPQLHALLQALCQLESSSNHCKHIGSSSQDSEEADTGILHQIHDAQQYEHIHTKQAPHLSLLDDTSSSPFFAFSKTSLNATATATATISKKLFVDDVLELSCGFSATQFKFITHPHAGDKWRIYLSNDYAHCIVDSLENITHSESSKFVIATTIFAAAETVGTAKDEEPAEEFEDETTAANEDKEEK